MYYFVHNVCHRGISFRMQYESYRMIQICQSTKAKVAVFQKTTNFPLIPVNMGEEDA